MTINSASLAELKRRRAILKSSAPNITTTEMNNILTASLAMTVGEFDAVVSQAKADVIVEPIAKTSHDITTEILKAKYAKEVK